jgi:hypothetical protein
VAEVIEKKELSEEEIVGEQLSKEYIEKVDFRKSAEVKMFFYVVAVAAALLVVAIIASQFTAK